MEAGWSKGIFQKRETSVSSRRLSVGWLHAGQQTQDTTAAVERSVPAHSTRGGVMLLPAAGMRFGGAR